MRSDTRKATIVVVCLCAASVSGCSTQHNRGEVRLPDSGGDTATADQPVADNITEIDSARPDLNDDVSDGELEDWPVDRCGGVDTGSGVTASYSFTRDGEFALDEMADDSGNEHHGARHGDATAVSVLIIGANTNDYASVPAEVLDGADNFSVEVRVQLDLVQAANNMIISAAGDSGFNEFGLSYVRDMGRMNWGLALHEQPTFFAPDVTVEDLEWHHVALVRRGGTARLYIDGEQSGPDLEVGCGPLTVPTGGLIIGQDQDTLGGGFQLTQALAGKLDNLRFYRRVLTLSEIAFHHAETGWGP